MSDPNLNIDPDPDRVASSHKRKSRHRTRSSSSSSSTSSSSSSSSSSDSRSSKRRHRRRQNRMLTKLSKEVSELRNQFQVPISSTPAHVCEQIPDFIDTNVSGSLFRDGEVYNDESVPDADAQAQPETVSNKTSDFKIQFETSVKEPSVPVTPELYLNALKSIQRFEDSTWSDIRYADVQKTYCHSPGFMELEANEEIKQFEISKSMQYAERSFAAVTFALLKQKEVLENGLNSFLKWTQQSESITPFDIKEKIEDIFVNGDYHKVSVDALQLVCGHRADLIQQRREVVLKQVKDPLIKTTLRKIPPSCSNLFAPEPFTSALEKAGGVRKNFWPLAKSSSNIPAAQAGTSGNQQRPAQGCQHSCNLSAQGNAKRRVPAQGTSYHHHHLPSQGNFYHHQQCCPAQGPNSSGYQRGGGHSRNSAPFRARPTSSYQEQRGIAKRPSSPNNKNKSNKRRKY